MPKAKSKPEADTGHEEHPVAQDMPPKETVTHSVTDDDVPGRSPYGHYRIIGEEVHGKNETRLFGTAVDEKTWMTKEEAKAKGFYWKN